MRPYDLEAFATAWPVGVQELGIVQLYLKT